MTKKKTTNEYSYKGSEQEAWAFRYAGLKRQLGPLRAEFERLDEQLKDFFRTHPDVRQLADVLFSVSQRRQLDTKAVRALLGERIVEFEKLNDVEQLIVQAPAEAL